MAGTAIILWRKILERELRAAADGRPAKAWTPAPAEMVPTLGFRRRGGTLPAFRGLPIGSRILR
jgi:hypothetical protein